MNQSDIGSVAICSGCGRAIQLTGICWQHMVATPDHIPNHSPVPMSQHRPASSPGSLFQLGEFTLASGKKSNFRIECDALTREDWKALAAMAAEILPPFGSVIGVPSGGIPFANALWRHTTPCGTLLIADDVCTSGGSLERIREGREAIGIVVFCRGQLPPWCRAIFSM